MIGSWIVVGICLFCVGHVNALTMFEKIFMSQEEIRRHYLKECIEGSVFWSFVLLVWRWLYIGVKRYCVLSVVGYQPKIINSAAEERLALAYLASIHNM